MAISTSRDGAGPGASVGEEQTTSTNPTDPQPESGDGGQDDTLPWDQIRSIFAYSDPPQTEQPLPNEPVNGGACDLGANLAPPNRPPVKKPRPRKKKQSRNALARNGGDLAGADYLTPERAQRRDLIPAPQVAVAGWPIVEHWPIVERPIVERIGVFGVIVAALAGVSMLLASTYIESASDRVLPPSLASAGGSLPSVQAKEVQSVMIDDRAALEGDLVQVSSAGATSTTSHPFKGPAAIAPGKPGIQAENLLQSAATEPVPSIPPAGGTLPTAAPLAGPASAPAALIELPIGLTKDEMSRLLKRGQDFLNEGDFATARLLFERAANAGSADAALALGSTYDPSVIKQLDAVSVNPDPDRALKWYATAADRGSSDALDRYAALLQAR